MTGCYKIVSIMFDGRVITDDFCGLSEATRRYSSAILNPDARFVVMFENNLDGRGFVFLQSYCPQTES